MSSNLKDIVIVGGGAVGLNTALFASMMRPRPNIHIYTMNGDPRLSLGKEPLAALSSTFGGGPTRMVTGKEGEPYFDGVGGNDKSEGAFSSSLTQGGWTYSKGKHLTTEYQRWIAHRNEQTKPENFALAAQLRKDHYVRANVSSLGIIKGLELELPHLFEGTSITNDGVLRLYDTPELYEEAFRVQNALGIVKERIPLDELKQRHPVMAEACDKGRIGGALTVVGRSLNIHRYFFNLMDYLENNGVTFHWNTKVEEVDFGSRMGLRHIKGLKCANGEYVRGKNIIMAPGAYSTELFEKTDEPGAVTGVAGVWSIMEMREGETLNVPTKIHGEARQENGRKYPFVDVNAIPIEVEGKKLLVLGSGYIGLGHPPYNISDARVQSAFGFAREEMLRMSEIILGDMFRDAKAEGRIDYCPGAACVRSFTKLDIPTHLERKFSFKTESGGIGLIHTGHNTGSFSESFEGGVTCVNHIRAHENDRSVA